jgi:hypothetical protein
MYFNQTFNQSSQNSFILAVWDDDGGIPGNLVYQQEEEMPLYEEELNRFHTYLIDTPFVVQDRFYIGWIQTSDTYLNLGFDIDRISNNKIFYYLSTFGTWLNSSFEGSLMMRPVLGSSLPLSVRDAQRIPVNELIIFPNPARDHFDLDLEIRERDQIQVDIFDRLGTLVRSYKGMARGIPVHDLKTGLYFIRVQQGGTLYTTKKLIVIH